MTTVTRALALAGALALVPRRRRPAPARASTTGSRRCRRPGTSCPTGATRSWAWRSTRPTRSSRRSSTAATPRAGAEPLPNAARSSADGLLIPGPLIQARVGDRLRIHFKNMDTLRHDPHSMHFHGVHYRPSSDGAYVPGFSGKRRRRQARPDLDLQADAPATTRSASGPTTTTRRRWTTRSPAACSGCSRSSGATSARPTASSRSCSRRSASSWRSTAARSSATRRCSSRASATSCSGT